MFKLLKFDYSWGDAKNYGVKLWSVKIYKFVVIEVWTGIKRYDLVIGKISDFEYFMYGGV